VNKKLLLAYYRVEHAFGLSQVQLRGRRLLKSIKLVDESLRLAQVANAEFVMCRICGEAFEFAENTQVKTHVLQHVVESCPGLGGKKTRKQYRRVNLQQ
jgi:hypothetical protein